MERFDVIVVGAGPAGSTAAGIAAQRGLKTLILEKECHPRPKPCGGALSPAVRRYVDVDYSGAVLHTARSVTFIDGSGREYTTASPPVHIVSRDAFDYVLAAGAVRQGAELREKVRVLSLTEEDGGVILTTAGGHRLKASVAVGADGVNSIVRKHGGFRIDQPGIAVSAEVRPSDTERLRPFEHRLYIQLGGVPDGYFWIFPKEGCLSVGLGTSRSRFAGIRGAYERHLQGQSLLAGFEERQRTGARLAFNRTRKSLNGRSLCLVGDAASLVDPLSGEGIYYAVKSGFLAGNIIAEDLDRLGVLSGRYTAEVNARIVSQLTYSRRLAGLFFRAPSAFLSRPSVLDLFPRLAAKEISYGEVFAIVKKAVGRVAWGAVAKRLSLTRLR